MPVIHPTATIEGDVQIADDVRVGPHCVLNGPITIGAGTVLIGHVYIEGPAIIGRGNTIYPFTCLGFAPQHTRFDPSTSGRGLTIGDDNTFRESVTVHRAFQDDGPTRIGDRNAFMVNSHVGHDCHVGNDCTLVNGALLGGHVTVEDRVIVGGNTGVHQFCRLGRCAMLGGGVAATMDVAPFFMLTGTNYCATINVIGARRAGVSSADIDDIRWAYRTLCRSGLTLHQAVEVLRERADRPQIQEYLTFIERSERGLATARVRSNRGVTVSGMAAEED